MLKLPRKSSARFGEIPFFLTGAVVLLFLGQGEAMGVGEDPRLDRIDSARMETLDDAHYPVRQLGTCGEALQNTENQLLLPSGSGPSKKRWR